MKVYSHNVFDWATCTLERCVPHEAARAMLLKGPKPPPQPDPNVVSAAQTKSNRDTAAYNNALTHGNIYSPIGSSTYQGHIDPKTGAMVYDQTINLSPDQQKLLDLQNAQSLQLGQTGGKLLGQINANANLPALKSSYSWDDLTKARQDVQDALYNRQTQYLDPQYAQASQALDTKLANQGIVRGSDAWNQEMANFGLAKTHDYGSARDSAIIGASGEMGNLEDAAGKELAQQMAIRSAPLNEYNALRSSSPVNVPNFGPAQNPLSANTDTASNTWNAYNGALNAWNAQQQSSNALTGGLMNLGGTLGGSYLGSNAGSAAISKIGK
jgi:hypothetical protein